MYKYVTLFDREGSLWARWSCDINATPPLFFEPLLRPPLGRPITVDAAAFRAFWSDSARIAFDAKSARLIIDDAEAQQHTRLACLYPEEPTGDGFTHVAHIDDVTVLQMATLSHDAKWGTIAAYVRVGDGQVRVWSTNRIALIRAVIPSQGEASFVLRNIDVRALRALKGELDVFMRNEAPQRLRLVSKSNVIEVEPTRLTFPNFDFVIKPSPSTHVNARELTRALKLARTGQRDNEAQARFTFARDALTIASESASTSVPLRGDAHPIEADFNPAYAFKLAQPLEDFVAIGIDETSGSLQLSASHKGVSINAVLACIVSRT